MLEKYNAGAAAIRPHFDALHNTSPEKEAADALREEIKNSPDALIPVGKIYYISYRGDDGNDGTSPETAWRTIKPYEKNHALFDDAGGATLLFERGGIYRGFFGVCKHSAYGAYGKGPKPEIWTSERNYAEEALWTELGDGLWSIDTYDSEGEPIWDIGLVAMENGIVGYKKMFSLDEVKADLDFYHDVDAAKLYMLSTSGNPGVRFNSIEMAPRRHTIYGYDLGDFKIDNLCIRYTGSHGMGFVNVHDVKITNCEIGWIGGSLLAEGVRFGNAVEFWADCDNVSVEHCYIYQCYDTAITHQAESGIQRNIRIANNLIEDCVYGLEFFVRDKASLMENVLYEDNIIRFSGYGWGDQRTNPDGNASIIGWSYPAHDNKAKNFIIRNNILSCGSWYLVYLAHPDKTYSDIRFIGNTYYQTKGVFTAAARWTNDEILSADDQISLEAAIAQIDECPKAVEFI